MNSRLSSPVAKPKAASAVMDSIAINIDLAPTFAEEALPAFTAAG
jgi:hypothetical protein